MTIFLLITLFQLAHAEYSSAKLPEIMRNYSDSTLLAMQTQNEALKLTMELHYQQVSTLIAGTWGEENVKVSNKTSFTQYASKMHERESIDFKNGMIIIEKVVKKSESVDVDYFQKKLASLMHQSLDQALYKDPIQRPKNLTIENQTVLQKLLIQDLIQPQFKNIQSAKIKKREIKEESENVIYYVEIPLVPDHLQQRVALYLPVVTFYAHKHHLKTSFVLGVIHTESYFNPLAVSKAPAYGLMQIVPETAGRDTYFVLYGQDKAPQKEYLFNPVNNIEMGTQYLHIIQDHYLKGIKDNKSKEYCMAVAYNAGIGNLYRVFIGDKYRNKEAINKINLHNSNEIYDKLRYSNVLVNEARNYVMLTQRHAQHYQKYD